MSEASGSVPASGGPLGPGRLRVLDALIDRLLPADELGGGAREACVPAYVERALREEHRRHAQAYADALDTVDAQALAVRGKPFASLQPSDQDAIVAELERGAIAGAGNGSQPFFDLLRTHVIEGMFGDPRWGGNADGIGWRLIGYPGPRLVWTEGDQQLGRGGRR